jgi:hypothetical protein
LSCVHSAVLNFLRKLVFDKIILRQKYIACRTYFGILRRSKFSYLCWGVDRERDLLGRTEEYRAVNGVSLEGWPTPSQSTGTIKSATLHFLFDLLRLLLLYGHPTKPIQQKINSSNPLFPLLSQYNFIKYYVLDVFCCRFDLIQYAFSWTIHHFHMISLIIKSNYAFFAV